jgi:hypothetical protein
MPTVAGGKLFVRNEKVVAAYDVAREGEVDRAAR